MTDTMNTPKILVIDDEAVVCISCERILKPEGYEVKSIQDPKMGIELAIAQDFDIILLDIVMPELDGIETLKQLKNAGVRSEVVIITGYATINTAVEAMKLGAADYVNKPFTPDELRIVLKKVMERSALFNENLALRRELSEKRGFEGIIGNSQAMARVFSLIRRVAPTEGTVLITGESGTGKEMVAAAIHNLSNRKGHRFLACDCSALAPSLLISELFGHVKGAYTGAISTKQGLIEAANKGTLFLDEIANISLDIQGMLLRVLETKQIRKVGDTTENFIDVRIIAATNRDLNRMVQQGDFREDLYYRLHVVPLSLPPLRERKTDIPLLAMTFLEHARERNSISARSFTLEAMQMFENYNWPGNVRELKNVIERISILCDSDKIGLEHLPRELKQTMLKENITEIPHNWEKFRELKQRVQEVAVRELERRFLIEALQRSEFNVTRAAEEVGMQRTNFHSLLRKYGISSRSG